MRNKFFASILLLSAFRAPAQMDSNIVRYWHYALSRSLGLENQLFRISQGSISVGSTSSAMWNIFNAATSTLSDYYYQPAQINNFSSSYGLILYNLSGSSTNCDITRALLNYINAAHTYAWDQPISTLTSKLGASVAFSMVFDTVVFDTTAISVDTSLNLFYNVNEMKFHFTAQYEHLVIFSSRPYSEKSNTFLPATYQPWYTQCAMATAYHDSSFPLWSSCFGASGFVKYLVNSLVVVSGKEKTDISGTKKTTLYTLKSPSASGGPNNFAFQKISSDTVTFTNSTSNSSDNPSLIGVIYNHVGDFIRNTQ